VGAESEYAGVYGDWSFSTRSPPPQRPRSPSHAQGTLAKEITTESPDKIETMAGQKLPLRMSVEEISFAAHVDYLQNRDFLRHVAAPKVILVHGEQNEMLKFKTGFERHFESDPDYR
jgi:cleavage and polyadenylation specificity factor subunit 3